MNNATDSRITAHLLSTTHYVAACNALLLALSAKYGGGLRCNLSWQRFCCTAISAFTSTTACSKTLPTTTTLLKTSTNPYNKTVYIKFQAAVR